MPSIHQAAGTKTTKTDARYRFIDRQLATTGQITRADLVSAFGISERQASANFGGYIDMAPNNMLYDLRRRAYVRDERFRAVYA